MEIKEEIQNFNNSLYELALKLKLDEHICHYQSDDIFHILFYKNKELHRLDGPAVERGDIKEWWIEGIQYTEKEFNRVLKLLYIL